ncbi:MAG: hypothetical protein EOO38_07875 [Cytophagaceae bacterium]|nr:MAG: hypothetical protein EOO38_07875 [Cytophagaceae bacterium]
MHIKKHSDQPCELYYDTTPAPEIGHYVLSMSRKTGKPTGNAYRITNVRKVKSDIHRNRYKLTCLRCLVKDIPDAAVELQLFWYSRNRK